MNAWLWPDHQIGKRESRRLREEHNKLVNSHAELLHVCRRFVEADAEYNSIEAPSGEKLDLLTLWKDQLRSVGCRYEAKTQRGLFFWAEKIAIKGGPDAWNVVAQMEGYPASEAHDDWFANFKDANEVARQLAKKYQPMKEAK